MSLEIVPSNNAAGQALARVLRLALPDDAACKRALQDALRSANRAELPSDGDELLRLVRVHLAPQLSKDVPPNLVFALIDDLKAEIEQQRSGRDPTSSSRMRAATSFPPPVDAVAGLPEPLPALGESRGEGPFPKLRASISNLLRTTSSAMRASGAPTGTAAPASAPPSVVVVESDRMMRAALARTLVGARFNVTVLEHVSELAEWMREHATRVVAVVDVMGDGVQGALQTVAAAHPSLSVVAWTDAAPSVVEGALSSLGLARYGVVSKGSAGAQVVDRVRALCAAGN